VIPYPHIDPVILRLGRFEIRWYGMMYVLGFIAGFFIIGYLAGKKKVKLTGDDLWDYIFYLMLGVLIGGRLGYCLFYAPVYYFHEPLKVFALWEGGMSFHGGFLGVALATAYYCWKKKVHFYDVGDIVAAATPVGLFLGRIGNFINGELYGRATDAAWGMVFPTDPEGLCRHPSQLYEAFLEGLVIFVIVFILNIRGATRGVAMWTFILLYGLSRFFVEFFRQPDPHLGLVLGPFTLGQLLTVPMILAGAVMIVILLLGREKDEKVTKAAGKGKK